MSAKTGTELVAKVREIAAEQPDFVYKDEGCVYVRDGHGSCIIGRAAMELGYIDASLEEQGLNWETVTRLANHVGIDCTRNEILWLQTVQSDQDAGVPWGDAVRIADKRKVW